MGTYNYFYKIEEEADKVKYLEGSLICELAYTLDNLVDILERYKFPELPIVRVYGLSDQFSFSDQVKWGDITNNIYMQGKNDIDKQKECWNEKMINRFLALDWIEIKNNREDWCKENGLSNYGYWVDFNERKWNELKDYFKELIKQSNNGYSWYRQD